MSELCSSFRFIEIQNPLQWFAVTFASDGYTANVIVSGFPLLLVLTFAKTRKYTLDFVAILYIAVHAQCFLLVIPTRRSKVDERK